MTETQHRFLKAIAERVDPARVVEVRLYPTVRAGQLESGVAIVATDRAEPDAVTGVAVDVEAVPGVAVDVEAETGVPVNVGAVTEPVEQAEAQAPAAGIAVESVAVQDMPRLSILTAHFRLAVKGPDRGRWEFAMVHDADAPIETVESVVRGVARRAGEDAEPELLPGEAFQRAISEPWWTPTT